MNTCPNADRDPAVRDFVRRTFGLRGTLKLHRAAIGADLLRAPVNVALAPVFLITRLLAVMARLCRLPKIAGWLATRKVLFQTSVADQVKMQILDFINELAADGLYNPAPHAETVTAIEDYVGIRNAVSEIVTSILVLICGFLIFQAATPGVISLAAPVAEMQAHTRAVESFWLGERFGRAYYGVFSTKLALWQIVITGVVLAMIASVITTFAGIIADPIQVLSGTHRRRITRLLKRLDTAHAASSGLTKEHFAARTADLMDIALNIWRGWRG